MLKSMCLQKNKNQNTPSGFGRQQQNGFTFVEVMATVAIIVILLAVSGVAVAQHRSYLQITELDNAARELYMAAENRAVLLAGAGHLDGLVRNEANALTLNNLAAEGEAAPKAYYVANNALALTELLPANSIEQFLRDGYFYIVYEPASGCVTDVFFARQSIEMLGEGDFQSFYDKWSQADRRVRMDSKPMLGYFGGGLAQGADIGMISTASVLVEIENTEELTVKVSCHLPGSLTLADADLLVELTCGAETIKLSDWVYNGRRTENPDGYTWLLDSLDTDKFKGLSDKLTPGADFTVKATLTSAENKFLPISDSDSSNSLFAYTADSNGNLASLQYLRHLQNLSQNFSGVSGKTQAVQIADIVCADNETYGDYQFLPIINDELQQFSGGAETGSYAVYNLLVTPGSADGQPGGLFASASSMQFDNVQLVNAHVDARDKTAGALVGAAANCTFNNCYVYWQPTEAADLRSLLGSDAEGSAYQYQILGNEAGGLIGAASESCQLNNCLAATLVQGDKAAGGMIGRASCDVVINQSYTDCYLRSSNTIGGVIGSAQSGLNFVDGYVAGYMDITTAHKAAGLCCGSSNAKVYTRNAYSVMLRIGENPANKFYELTENQTIANVDQFENTFYLGGGEVGGSAEYQAVGKSYAEMTAADFVGALKGNFERKTARQSHPYNLREHLQLVVYSFPGIRDLPHYGDWGAQFKEPSLVYYEQYSDGSYGFSGGNARYLINELQDTKTVVSDGYAVAFLAEDLGTANQITLKYGWFDKLDAKQSRTVTHAKNNLLSASGRNEEGNLARYYLAPLPEDFVNSQQTSAYFYRYLQFTLEIGSNAPVSGEYFYNPHFAETVVPYVELESEPIIWTAASAAKYAADLTGDLAAISVRTPRHLYNIANFADYYHNNKYNYLFRQNLALNYADYSGYGLFAAENEQGVFAQKPIGSYAQPFKGVYNGGCRSIEGVAFQADSGSRPYYAGLFGYSVGTLRDIVYLPDAEKQITLINSDGSNTMYVGGLLGGNAGTVQNCAVSGLRLGAYAFGAEIYGGGLVGQNNGIIRDCAAEVANLFADESGYAKGWLGGLVGQNTRSVSNSYAVGRLSVTVDGTSAARLCGFVGENGGSINSCYAAADLQSSGLNSEIYGFGAQGGLQDCYFLNEGNFTYRDKSYIASYAAGSAVGVSYADLSTGNVSLNGNMRLGAGDYPYPSAVRSASGAAVHYGEWPTPMELGEMGVYYWETLELGGKETYHVSLLAVEPADKTIKRETTLSEAYDDGGVVTDYGYGYYNKKGSPVTPTAENIYYTSNGKDNQVIDVRNNVGRDTNVDQELVKLMPDFEFHSWHSYQPDSDSRRGIYPYRRRYSTTMVVQYGGLTLKQGNISVKFKLNPHFAAALAVESNMGTGWQIDAEIKATPGSEQNPYGVRSVAQLELINWNIDNRNTRTVLEMTNNNKKFSYLSYPGHTDKYYWRQSHDLDGKMQEYTPIAEYYDTTTPKAGDSNEKKNRGFLHGWFGGVYNGQDYVIADMNIKGQVASCAGLFGAVYNGKLENIILYSSNGNGKISASGRQTDSQGSVLNKSMWYAIGGLAGLAASGSDSAVENCAVAGYTIEANVYTAGGGWGGSGIGGLVGISNMALSGCTAETVINIPATAQDNDNMRVGGLVGTCQQSITDCYAGGSISVANKAAVNTGHIYIGGIVGGSYMKPLQVGEGTSKLGVIGFVTDAPNKNSAIIDRVNGIGMTDNAIYNCYSYVQLPANNAHARIEALYALGGTGDIITSAEDPGDKKKLNHGTCTIGNSYYLDSIRPTVLVGQKTDVNGTSGVHQVSYRQLQGAELINGQRIYALLSAFQPVTSTMDGISLSGKYSFPPSKRTELHGRDYPFPTILTRENGAYHVHYGGWPNFGIERAEGGAPIALDIFAQPDYQEQLKLTGVAGGGSWSVRNENAEIAAAEIDGGNLSVWALGVGTTRLTIVYNLNGTEYQLPITVNVTAELHLAPQALTLFAQDKLSVPMQLLDKQGQVLPDFDGEQFKLTAVDCSSSYFKAEIAALKPEGETLARPGLVLSRNTKELPEPQLNELINISYTYIYNEVTYSGSDAVAVTLGPAPEPVEVAPGIYMLTFAAEGAEVVAAGVAQSVAEVSFAGNVVTLQNVQADIAEIPLEISLNIAGQRHEIKLQAVISGEATAAMPFSLRQDVYAVKPDTEDDTEAADEK